VVRRLIKPTYCIAVFLSTLFDMYIVIRFLLFCYWIVSRYVLQRVCTRVFLCVAVAPIDKIYFHKKSNCIVVIVFGAIFIEIYMGVMGHEGPHRKTN